MTRIISPKRDTKTGELYHYCPLSASQIGPTDCQATLDNAGADGVFTCSWLGQLEELSSKYRVHCNAPVAGVQLIEYESPKAHDSYRGLKGPDTVESNEHTWVEPKLDGARAIVHCTPEGVIITSRRREKTGAFRQFQDNVPHLRDHPGLVALGKRGYTILDGEIIMSDPDGGMTLGATMGVVSSLPERAIASQRELGLAALHLFDCPWVDGVDITGQTLRTRRAVLDAIHRELETDGVEDIALVPVCIVDKVEARRSLVSVFIERGLEGAVLKDPGSGYFASQAWLKAKQKVSMDAQVTGWKPGAAGGKHAGGLGAVAVSVIDRSDGCLREIAFVIPGDDVLRDKLYRTLRFLPPEDIVQLDLIVELEGQGFSKDYRIRHPRILRWRRDRSEPNMVDFATVQQI